jgi:hypothetical protein
MKTKTLFYTPADLKLPENRAAGIRTPGWNIVQEWTDSNGNVRRRVEPVVVNSVVETPVEPKPVEEIKQEPVVVNSVVETPVEEIKQEPVVVNSVVETPVEEIKQEPVNKTKAKSK